MEIGALNQRAALRTPVTNSWLRHWLCFMQTPLGSSHCPHLPGWGLDAKPAFPLTLLLSIEDAYAFK